MDVLPHIELGPVADREDTNAFVLVDSTVVQTPQFRTLIFWIPTMVLVPEAKDSFLGPRLLFVSASSSECGIVTTGSQRLFEGLGLHDVGVVLRTMLERVDALVDAFLIRVHPQFKAKFFGDSIAKLDHFPELPRGVDVKKRKRNFARIERLARQVKQYRRILADRIQHHRSFELRHDLADDVDRLGFKLFEVCEPQLRGQCGGSHGQPSLERTASGYAPNTSVLGSSLPGHWRDKPA